MDSSNQASQSDQSKNGSTAAIIGHIGGPDERVKRRRKSDKAAIAELRELSGSLEIMQHEIDVMKNGLAFNPITPQQSQDSVPTAQLTTEHASEDLVHLRMMKDLAKRLFTEATSLILSKQEGSRDVETTAENYGDLKKQYNKLKEQFDVAHAKYTQGHPSQEMSQLDSLGSQRFSQ